MDGHYLLSIDGTGQYSSNKGCCGECCERNAAKRLLENIKREHPHLKLIIIEDALSSNGPHIELIKSLNIRFILSVKPDDNKSLNDTYCDLKMNFLDYYEGREVALKNRE